MKAGVVVDDWKLPVFRKRLTENGFAYTDAGGLTPGVTALAVIYERETFAKLMALVTACEAECAKKGRPGS